MRTHRRFFLLRPQQLPRSRAEFVATTPVTAALSMMRLSAPPSSDENALEVARAALVQLGVTDQCFTPVVNDADESPGNRANDEVFAIVRVTGPSFPMLVHSTVQGFIALLEEAIGAGANVTPVEWSRLRAAFAVLFDTFGGENYSDETAQDPAALRAPPAVRRDSDHSALQRWRRGHHMFMVVIQGLVVLFNSFRHEIETSNFHAAQALLDATTRVMAGVGPALQFTGDFCYSDYEKEVRPTLMPPQAPPGLTGLYWRDHEYLMKLLGRMRPILMNLGTSFSPCLHHLHEALASAYDSHKVVCSSFVGSERSSLLMASRTRQPAVETLDHFMRVRLQLVKPPAA
jgi:hypothetical protein